MFFALSKQGFLNRSCSNAKLVTQPTLDANFKPNKIGTSSIGILIRGSLDKHRNTLVLRAGNVSSESMSDIAAREENDDYFMLEALKEAKRAFHIGEVPVGAVMVKDGKIISRAHNMVELLMDPSAHAEVLCVRQTCSLLSNWRLIDCTLYVTLEPCVMCGGAILQSRIHRLVWGAPNKLLGCDGSQISLFPDKNQQLDEGGDDIPLLEKANASIKERPASFIHPFHSETIVCRGVLKEECSEIMKEFFRQRRKQKKSGDKLMQASDKKRNKSMDLALSLMLKFYYGFSLWQFRVWK